MHQAFNERGTGTEPVQVRSAVQVQVMSAYSGKVEISRVQVMKSGNKSRTGNERGTGTGTDPRQAKRKLDREKGFQCI